MPSEFAPPWGRPRVTKAQIKKMQAQYRKAQAQFKDLSEEEQAEKQAELERLEELLDEEF